jgi:mono/diheme cytochrome c family protein
MVRRPLVFAALVWAAAAGCSTEVASGRADGAAIFSEVCARCHGPDGVPDQANVARIGVKPLNSPHVQGQLTDDEIRQQILRGSRNKQMPAFAGALSDAQVKAIIAHVRTLAHPGQPSLAGQQADRAQ